MDARLLTCAALAALAACSTPAPPPDRADPRIAVLPPAAVDLAPGHTAEAVVRFAVAEGYHVQANPVPMSYLIPTELEIDRADGWALGTPVYPTGDTYRLEGSPDELWVYDGAVEIRLPLRPLAGTRPGTYTLEGRLRYQLCDDRLCFQPASRPVRLTVHVHPAPRPSAKPVETAVFPTCGSPAPDPSSSEAAPVSDTDACGAPSDAVQPVALPSVRSRVQIQPANVATSRR